MAPAAARSPMFETCLKRWTILMMSLRDSASAESHKWSCFPPPLLSRPPVRGNFLGLQTRLEAELTCCRPDRSLWHEQEKLGERAALGTARPAYSATQRTERLHWSGNAKRGAAAFPCSLKIAARASE